MITTWINYPLSPEIILMSPFTVEKLDEPTSHPAMQLLASRAGAVIFHTYDTAYDAEIVIWTDERAGKTNVMEGEGL